MRGPRHSPPRRLPRLSAIVGQAWLIGAVGGTAVDVAALRLVGASLPSDFAAMPLGLVVLAALGLSSLPCVVGIVAVVFLPRFVLHHRLMLCLAVPPAIAALWMALAVLGEPDSIALTPVVFLDAGLAALWFWHRTKRREATSAASLAAVFD